MSVYLVTGHDPVLRDRAMAELVAELVGPDDRSFVLEEFTVPTRSGSDADDGGGGGADARQAVVAAVLNAATSPPFMTDRRVVVVRDAGALTAADAEPLVRYCADPLDTTQLVFVAGGGTIPPALVKQTQASGAETRAPASEKTGDVLADALHDADLRMRAAAAKLVTQHLGEDAGRVHALVEVLAAAYPPGAQLGADEITPYLGDAGGVPGFQLTNAIETGDTAAALDVLHRLLRVTGAQQSAPMHPLQVMGLLTSYYRRILRLDDPGVRTSDDAVAALGGRVKQYPARKAMEQARALGTDGIRRAFDYLHQADLDLKGKRGIPADAVMEVLVVRLAAIPRSASASG